MLLALYPAEQQTLLAETQSVFDGSPPAFEHYSKLSYTMAVIQEGLRLYPPVVTIPKVAMRDTSIPASTVPSGKGERAGMTSVFVPKGTKTYVLTTALHYSELYWDRPFEFRPERFVDTEEYRWNRDAWAPFSGGARQCMGQRFALGKHRQSRLSY